MTLIRQGKPGLLSKLSDDSLHLLLPRLEVVQSKLHDVLYAPGVPIAYVYFPCSAIYSCLVGLGDGSSVEIGTIGNEGFVGVELLMEASAAIEKVICQHAGISLRMSAGDFRLAMEDSQALRKLATAYGLAYLSQVSQSVACNRLHSVEMRFARWLLITHDRVKHDEFDLTQEFVALMLGVHRPRVSQVASGFMREGIIAYQRGRMKILDRARLEEIGRAHV